MIVADSFPCYMVRKGEDGNVSAKAERITVGDLPAGDVLIRVAYSSLNYKDALATQAHPGVVRSLPHIPGIDCAGVVAESSSPQFKPGDDVLVTGYDLGASQWGGFSAFVRVPADWIVPLPRGLTVRDAMIYGTAGFTAAQCVTAIVDRGIGPDHGSVVVTGATGGVGSLSVAILAKLGYEVEAVTGKAEHHDWLRKLGAKKLLGRDDVDDKTDRQLLAARWAAAVDTVGGNPLATLLRAVDYRGCVAACGLVAGVNFNTSVYPFILRGITLAGIDSAKCPRPERMQMWEKLSGPWRLSQLDEIADEITFDELPDRVAKILRGGIVGRTIVAPRSTAK
ncbi:MAG TPA: oxidoreductase [Lacipirellulaceae bacterium]|jgi:acrylyl-CoA reductase (NADPH)|nr:oxidoreductase [Lacipirellulaceae bacterium]